MFAATFGRLLRTIAHSILERGGKIGLLDQLVGSSSVSSALVAQIAAGRNGALGVHLTGLGLVFLWLLSPLGSQAVLQISSRVTDNTSRNQRLLFANTEIWDKLPGLGTHGQLTLIAPNTLLNSALIGPLDSKDAQRDTWGHVKIPNYDRIAPNDDQDGWRQVQSTSINEYTSLIGVPIGNLSTGNTTTELTLSTWYRNLTCRPWEVSNAQANFTRATVDEIIAGHVNTRYLSIPSTATTLYTTPAMNILFDDAVSGSFANGSARYLGNRATAACNVDLSTNDDRNSPRGLHGLR